MHGPGRRLAENLQRVSRRAEGRILPCLLIEGPGVTDDAWGRQNLLHG
ncbi:trans-sialidase, putative, partial [Trypanosoma cruzi marinkellei]